MAGSPALAIELSARRRIAIRILPFLWFLYVVAFLDRVNVAYAALEMSHDLRFSDRVFGLGAGIFFVGYVLLEIPGALIVERWSARLWITRIMITWGIITVFVGFVHTAHQFYLARFLLGAAEAGFFPGVIVYLTHWFTRRDLAKAVASFMAAIPLANLLGSPLAGRVLRVHWYGLQGWRWLFILEGIPAVVLRPDHVLLSHGQARAGRLAAGERTRVDYVRIGRGTEAQGGGALVHDRAGAAAAKYNLAHIGLFHGQHRLLRLHHVVPHHTEARVRLSHRHRHAAGDNSLSRRTDRNVAEQLAFRPDARAPLARRGPSIHRRSRLVVGPRFRLPLLDAAGIFQYFCRMRPRVSALLLGPSDPNAW